MAYINCVFIVDILVGMISQLKSQLASRGDVSEVQSPVTKAKSFSDLQTPSVSSIKSNESLKPLPALGDSKTDLRNSIPALTTAKAKAFEIFRNGYPSSEWIDGQKTLLKQKYIDAKALGESANHLRLQISKYPRQTSACYLI